MPGHKFAGGVGIQHVRIPKRKIPALPVEPTAFFAQAEKSVLVPAPPDADKMIVQSGVSPRSSLAVGTRFEDHASIRAARLEAERIFENGQHHGRSRQTNVVFVLLHGKIRFHRSRIRADRIAGRFLPASCVADLELEQIFPQHGHPEPLGLQLQFDASVQKQASPGFGKGKIMTDIYKVGHKSESL